MEPFGNAGQTLGAKDYLDRVNREIQPLDLEQVENLSQVIEDAYHAGRFVFIIGNGGSGANASHLCEDLAKCTLRDFENQKRLKVLSLTDNTAGIMALANDEGYDRIFIEQLKNLASPGDLLLAISGSGNSPNILRAVEWANANGMITVGITGFGGGKLKGAGPPQPPRGDRRHGDRRVAPHGRLPLGHRRPQPPLRRTRRGRRLGSLTDLRPSRGPTIIGTERRVILYAVMSETFSNCWKWSVISVPNVSTCVVVRPFNGLPDRDLKAANVGW